MIKCSEILTDAETEGFPTHGIGLFEVLQHLAETELKFVREQPMQFSIPVLGARHGLFLASVFGALPAPLDKQFTTGFAKLPGLKRTACSIRNYWEFLARENLFLRRIGMLDIRTLRRRSLHSDCLFFMDANVVSDVLDYWNLRAVGWSVIPICRQVAREPAVQKFASEIVERNSFPLRANPQIYNETVMLKSRAAPLVEFLRFGKTLTLTPPRSPNEQKVVQQIWFPRIWDEWAREKDGAEPCDVEVIEKEFPVNDSDETLRFKSVLPDFAHRFGGHHGPRCANEVELRLWSREQPLAEVIPVGGPEIARAAGGFDFMEWRCAKTGLVHLPRFNDWPESIHTSAAQSVFAAWLSGKKWTPELSDKGHIAQQMFKHLGGEYGLGFLTIPGIVEFIDEISKKASCGQTSCAAP